MPDTHDERGPFCNDLRSQLVAAGTEAAEQWLAVRANRKMSDVNRKRLAGHVVNALWAEIERAAVEMAQYVGDEQLAAATARAEKAERQFNLVRSLNRLAKANAVELHAQLDAVRARIAELGKPEVEYGLQYGAAAPQALRAQDEIAYYRRQRHSGLRVRDAYRSQWRLAPETGCRSCGTTDRVLGDPPLCSNCAVYAPASFTGLLAAPRLAPDAAQDGLSATETDADGSQGSGVELEFGSGSAGLSEPQAPADCDEPNADGTCRHLTCGRCKQHTNDTHQGHYWAWCKVAKTTREFHFCCPGDCELERTDTTEDGRHG